MKHTSNKMVVMIAILLYANITSSLAATYYFSTSGSDSNSGLTTALPKKSIAAAAALMTGGNIILFNRGDIWYIGMDSLNLTGKSNFTLDAYGTGNKPIIAGMGLLDGTWTYTGSNNIWKSVDTRFNFAHRVFVNGVSRINLTRKFGNTNTLADLDSLDEYYYQEGAASSLYIKTTSATVAPTGVEIIPGRGGYYGGVEVVQMKNTSNVTISNIEFRGGSRSAVIIIEAPSSNITINSCIIGRAYSNGITVANYANNADVVQNINITNCTVDKGWNVAENNVKSNIVLEGDGIAFLHGVNTGTISGNTITNFGHDGICLFGYLNPLNYGVKYVKVEMNDVSAGNSAYMHAIDIIGNVNKVMYNIVKRNYFHHFTTGCTIGGNVNFVFSNIFSNVLVSPNVQQSQSPWAISLASWTLSSASLVAKDNWVCNNTIYNTDAYSILLDRADSDSTSVSNNKIMNNICMNFGRDTSYPLDPEHSFPPPRVALRFVVSVPMASTLIRNNNFWANYDTTATKKVALYRSSFYTASTLNGCAECGLGNSTGNVQLNPRFDSFFGLTAASSPTLQSGGFNYATNIIGWGLPSAEFVDYYGTPWPANPSIGAIQY
ncbi:right-handed parallel beta-helix repeat-containing protein [Chitinophaga filiformis]|uniref:right-handed parallel beta-helix repeat-containing protein n=1 Tax=Chitinophaga filiformis TaxID=104663 RepID=UPI001F3C59BF|nr:right-handed parallel beta-helix repeat-containing protein [Chitinophaga filiformis]MCF6403110.1 right-handed parallel beta-helix repeat-containing protein [Chitinophaga filiformis]